MSRPVRRRRVPASALGLGAAVLALTVLALRAQDLETTDPLHPPDDGKVVEDKDWTKLTYTDDQGSSLFYGRLFDHPEHGPVVTAFWLYEEIYSTPSGEGRVLDTVACENRCSRPGDHAHAACTLGGCSQADTQVHRVRIKMEAEDVIEEQAEILESVRRKVVEAVKLAAKVGVKVGPAYGELSAEYQRQVETEVSATVERAIRELHSRRIAIDKEFEVGHFNRRPCQTAYRDFGVERRDLWTQFILVEQLYRFDTWTIGSFTMRSLDGRTTTYHRVPRRLTQVGNALRETFGPHKVGSYWVATNAPLKERDGEVNCPCRRAEPPPVPTPGAQPAPGDDRSSLLVPPRAFPGGRLTGWVIGADGQGVPGTRVAVGEPGALAGLVVSDGQGRFETDMPSEETESLELAAATGVAAAVVVAASDAGPAVPDEPTRSAQPGELLSYRGLFETAHYQQGDRQRSTPVASAVSPDGRQAVSAHRLPADLEPGPAGLTLAGYDGSTSEHPADVFLIVDASLEVDKLNSGQRAGFHWTFDFGRQLAGASFTVTAVVTGAVDLAEPATRVLEVGADGQATYRGVVQARPVPPGSELPFGIHPRVHDRE